MKSKQLQPRTTPLCPEHRKTAAASIASPTASAAVNPPRLPILVFAFSISLCAAVGASRQQLQSDWTDLSAELLPELSEFESASDINKFLARLLVQVTKGRVSPRGASVLAYITNQLLHSHCALNAELTAEANSEPRIIFDLPRPDRDAPAPPAAPRIFSGIPGIAPLPEKKLS